MCWDLTPGGVVARQQCPDYVNGLSQAGMYHFFVSCYFVVAIVILNLPLKCWIANLTKDIAILNICVRVYQNLSIYKCANGMTKFLCPKLRRS